MRRLSQFLAAGFITALATTATAHAEPVDTGQTSVNVGPVTAGPVLSQGNAGFGNSGIAAAASASTPQTGSQQSLSTGLTFTYTPIPDNTLVAVGGPPQANNGVIAKPGTGFQPACPPGQTGYYVYDSAGQFAGVVCVPNSTATPTPGSAAEIAMAEEASSRQPWPNLSVGVNPDRGLTGLQSWFWLRPANAAMRPASATAGPLTVTVRAALIDVLWDFGDGSQTDAGLDLGQAYPRESAIRHVYQTDTFQLAGGYQVLATLRFGIWYSVNSGPWRFLGTKAKSFSVSYSVNQIQPEGVPANP
ncbi:MAG: hypothetical protein QOH92_610 [Chloroflexota bacterium]|nr:hypothetical protein [Chloroflexota bacterium]